MADSTVDADTRQRWKASPLRIVFGTSSCCNASTILVQVSPSGFVKRKCTKCGESDTLKDAQFHCLDLWIACPKCTSKMQPGREFYEQYAYICKACRFAIKLGDILPDESPQAP